MNTKELLEHVADPLVDHTDDTCGLCARQLIQAAVAKEILVQTPEPGEALLKVWSQESDRRWRESKFVKLWEEEKAAGREPTLAFEAKGWQP